MEPLDKSLLRSLPKVDDLMKNQSILDLMPKVPRTIIVDAVRKAIEVKRQEILAGSYTGGPEDIEQLVVQKAIELSKEEIKPNLCRVINATGVVLHTNLGRALLSCSAKEAVEAVASSYCNLEINLHTGKRGSRYEPVEDLLTRLTGAEAALVVNNNAAAVLLALGTMAKGKEVIVSRGQLVEIGGSFRIPEVMAQSGAQLVEVGATNKTHPQDYLKAITAETALLLHVHTSNYRIVGFTRETSVEELVQIGADRQIPVMSDLGSGFLVDLAPYGLPQEPSVQEIVAAGADVVTFSGDKLLGGPQAGIIVGKRKWIDQMKKNPLTRAIRINKFTVAALEATLREYIDKDNVLKSIPTLRMLTEAPAAVKDRAEKLLALLKEKITYPAQIELAPGTSQVGGGSMPTAELPTYLVTCVAEHLSVEELSFRLRLTEPAVVGRVQDNKYQVDLRTVQPEEIELLADVMSRVINSREVSGR